MVGVRVVNIIGDGFNAFAENLVYDAHAHDRLAVCLFVRVELILPVQMDTQVGQVHKWPRGAPVLLAGKVIVKEEQRLVSKCPCLLFDSFQRERRSFDKDEFINAPGCTAPAHCAVEASQARRPHIKTESARLQHA